MKQRPLYFLFNFAVAVFAYRDSSCSEELETERSGNLLMLVSPREIALLLKANPPDRNDKLREFVIGNEHLKEPGDSRGIFPEKLDAIAVYLSDFLGGRRVRGFPERKGLEEMKLMAYGYEEGFGISRETVLGEIESDFRKAIAKCDENVPSKLNTRGEVDKYELIFHDIPSGDPYKVDEVGIRREFVEYSKFSKLIGFLHPGDFPLKLLQESLKKNPPLHILILQIIKLEGLVLCWIVFWGIISACLPIAILTNLCCSKKNSNGNESILDENGECTNNCCLIILYLIMLSLLGCILLMLGSNDKLSRSLEKLPFNANIVLSDLETFVKNSHLQMNFATATAFEQVAEKIRQDLKDVDKLLGERFKEDLERETHLEPVIEGVDDLKSRSAGISGRVDELLRECVSGRKSSRVLQEALDELSRQLNSAKKYCQQKDRSLCESLNPMGLSLALNADEVVSNPVLRYFEKINRDSDFNSTIEETVRSYRDVPKFVFEETVYERTAVYDILQKHRRHVYDSLRSLEDLSRSLRANLKETWKESMEITEGLTSKDLWRYLAVVGTTLLIFAIWALFVCGSPCGCHVVTRTEPFLTSGLVLMSLTILIVWVFGSVSFIFGGHGQSIICDRLYEDHFKTLSKIFDRDGIIYEEGLFKRVLNSNETIRIEDVLKGCERNQTSYQTFHLENRLDVTRVLNFKSWSDFRAILDGIKLDTKRIRLRSNALEAILVNYKQTGKLRELRSKLSLPVTHKELVTFKQQIYSVAKQISNSKSANAYQKIILRLEEIIQKEYAKVKNFRDAILFKLTSIEIIYQPLGERVERFLNQLKDAQEILEEKGEEIAERNVRKYAFRFERYLNDLQKYTNEQLRRKTAKCRPLWDLFDFARHQICAQLVDPLNALAFSYFATTIIFISITPSIIHLVRSYKKTTYRSSYRRYSASINQDQSVWATPRSGTPMNDNGIEARSETNPIEIPSPPKFPSLPIPISSTSSSGTNKTIPKLSTILAKTKLITKPIKSKYDSLKYIERISKSPRPGQSPRGWL